MAELKKQKNKPKSEPEFHYLMGNLFNKEVRKKQKKINLSKSSSMILTVNTSGRVN